MTTQETLVQFIREQIGNPRFGVEVGVYKGETSQALLDGLPSLAKLVLVDPWREWPEGSSYRKHRRTGSLTQAEWNRIHSDVVSRFFSRQSPHLGKVEIYRYTSAEAVAEMMGKRVVAGRRFDHHIISQFDFVYLDGDHTYEHVLGDIRLWLPLVRPGGLLCGHDFGGTYKGVEQAVYEMFPRDDVILPGKRIWGYAKP